MKAFFVSLIMILISQINMYAQEFKYFDNLDQALKYYHEKRYADAGRAFELAFTELKGKSTQSNFYNAACAWSLAKNNDKAFFYLQKIIDGKVITGWDDPVEFYDMLIKDSDFLNITTDPRWTILLQEAERNKTKFLKGIKQELADPIKKMGVSDQAIRLKLDSVRKISGLNSEAEQAVITEMKKRDSANFKVFEEIITKYGWLGPHEIGYKNNQYLFLILQHADLESQRKYLPLFRKSHKLGRVLPKDLAYLEDRVNMRDGKMQQYGSQTLIDKNTKKYILFPVEDVEHVDERRAAVGLESLKSYIKSSFNNDFDINKYKEELPELKVKYIKYK
ncbi:DUF6624 domain-containing protein [Pedobacter agri]|uniref:DUF6624 domain-containing protein n=1 Tax=Pedobacter agri TaxID=454586 RepID=UPI00292D2E1E|nr:DUF6624 domain-containing protein [Pedobacter agri]